MMIEIKSVLMKKTLFIAVLLFAGRLVLGQSGTDIIDYINTYKQIAISEEQRTGVPAAIKLAQGIHETYAGKSDLVLKSNNHFGIKCKETWTGEKVYHDDDARGECFRRYAKAEDSYVDHSNFLRGSTRYAFLFNLDPTDYKGWAYGLKKAGYATNNRYSQIIIKLIEDYNLQQYTLIALGKLSPDEEVLVKSQMPDPNTIVPNATTPPPVSKTIPEAEAAPPVIYPSGEFKVNNTRVVFAKAGSSLLSIADEYGVTYARLLEFNDMQDVSELAQDQLVYLQRKRKVGNVDSHIVQKGETLYSICQAEGIRLESLAEYNNLTPSMQPAAGEKLNLRQKADSRPMLESEVKAATAPIVADEARDSKTETHIVQTNETLYSIAKKYGVAVEDIREWNRLSGFDLKIGQELVIHKN
jgi:LysM repeat protein